MYSPFEMKSYMCDSNQGTIRDFVFVKFVVYAATFCSVNVILFIVLMCKWSATVLVGFQCEG